MTIENDVDKTVLKIICFVLSAALFVITVKVIYQSHADEQARILYRECLRLTELAIKENNNGRFVSLPSCRL